MWTVSKKKLLKCIFGGLKLQLGPKKLNSLFHRRSLMIFLKLALKSEGDFSGIFFYKKVKILKKKKIFNIFGPSCSLGPPKMHIIEFSLKNFHTIFNASYFIVENFEKSGPFLWNQFFFRIRLLHRHVVLSRRRRRDFKVPFTYTLNEWLKDVKRSCHHNLLESYFPSYITTMH